MLQSDVKGDLHVTGNLITDGSWEGVGEVVGYTNHGLGQQVVADTTMTYIDGLTEKEYPSTPDGTKTFLLTAVLNYIHTGANGYCVGYLFYGPGVWGLDTEADEYVRVRKFTENGQEGQIKITGVATPGIDEIATVGIQAENGGVTIEGGSTLLALGCTLVIERLT